MTLKEQIINLHKKENKTPKEISLLLKISLTTVYRNLKGIRTVYKRGPKPKVPVNVILNLYNSGKDAYEIAKLFNIDPKTVWYHVNLHGKVRPRGTTVNKNVKSDYFSLKKMTNESGYWLGFIFGDGNISGNRLTIQLASKDEKHLIVLKNILNIKSHIRHRVAKSTSFNKTGTMCYGSTLAIANTNIITDLKFFGVRENKTYVGGNPINIPNSSIVSNIILGLLDSDGWVSIDKNNRYTIGWCGHYDNMKWIRDNLNKYLGIDLKIHTKKSIYSLTTSDKNKMFSISKWLLNNSTYSLKRKRIKLEKMLYDRIQKVQRLEMRGSNNSQ